MICMEGRKSTGRATSPMGYEENFEIGRVLHLKAEIRNLKSDRLLNGLRFDSRFRISVLSCRIRPISKFMYLIPTGLLVLVPRTASRT